MVFVMTTRSKVPKFVWLLRRRNHTKLSLPRIETTIKEMHNKEPPLSLPCSLIRIGISKIGMEPTNLSKSIGSTKVESLVKTLQN